MKRLLCSASVTHHSAPSTQHCYSGTQHCLSDQWTPTRFGRIYARTGEPVGVAAASLPVMLVHGLVVSSRYMVPTAERLAGSYRVFAIDLPGYGKSDKPSVRLSLAELADAIAEWMDRQGFARADFIANSFGCQVLAEFAVRHADRVSRLVWQGPTIDPAARTLWQQLRRLLKNSRRESPRLGWITLRDYLAAGPRRVVHTVRIALADRIEGKLAHVKAPVLVVRGERDPVVTQKWAETVVRLLPRGQLAVMAGLAHTINYTAPDRFVEVIRRFLKR